MAADAGRVLVTADVRTMLVHFEAFIRDHDSPGLILIPSSRSFGAVIDALLLIWLNWMPGQLKNRVVWLPNASGED